MTPLPDFSEVAETGEFTSFLMPAKFMPINEMEPVPGSRVAP